MIKNITDKKVTQYSLFAAFGGFVFGLDAANISGVVRFITAQFELNSLQVGTVVGCAIIGVILALFFTGTLCDRFGRKKILIAIALTYSLSSIISSLAVSYPMLVFGRFIGGVAFASITVSAMYIGEIAPAKTRGRFVSVNQLLITLGSLVAFIVNYFLIKAMVNVDWIHEQNVWRMMLGFELIANAIWVFLLLKIPESPRWLIIAGRTDEAREVFKQVASAEQIEKTIQDVQHSVEEDSKHDTWTQLKTLFSKPMMFVVMLAVVYAIVQGATGMNAVLFFAPTVFEQIGMSVEDTFMRTIVLGLVAVIFTLVAIVFVEKWGRRVLTITGLFFVVIAHASTWYGFNTATYTLDEAALVKIEEQKVNVDGLKSFVGTTYATDVELKRDLAEVYSNKELSLVSGPVINATIDINPVFVLFGIFAFLAAFNMSIGPIMWVIFSEIFPNRVRSVALPFAALVQSISSYLIQQFFPWQLENMGVANTFLNYGILAFIGMVFMFFFLPETKGKSIEEIEDQLVPNGKVNSMKNSDATAI